MESRQTKSFGAQAVRRLKNYPKSTFLHRVERFDCVKVFDDSWASRLVADCVSDLQGVGKCSQSLNRFVVGVANLLSLVCVHRFEDPAKYRVGCRVFVVLDHSCASVSEKCWSRLFANTHEPCN